MKYFWLSFLFFVVAYLVPLGGRPLVPPDEFRYAEIPREMMDSGSYAAPHLLTVRYFEKPVLGYWMTAGSFKIFGQNAFALRLPCALGAGLAAFLIFFLVNQTLRDDKLAALASMLFLTSGLVYGVSTFAVLDSQTTGLITGILVTSGAGVHPEAGAAAGAVRAVRRAGLHDQGVHCMGSAWVGNGRIPDLGKALEGVLPAAVDSGGGGAGDRRAVGAGGAPGGTGLLELLRDD